MKKETPHKNNPYGIPKDYFKSFEDGLMAKIEEDELRKLVPESGFSLPDDYFNSVESKVLGTLKNERGPKVVSLISRKSIIAVAAVAASLLLIVTLFNKPTANSNLSLATIETETLESFINSDAIAYSKEELINFYSDEDLEFTGTNTNQEISEEALTDYLIDYLDATDLTEQYEE